VRPEKSVNEDGYDAERRDTADTERNHGTHYNTQDGEGHEQAERKEDSQKDRECPERKPDEAPSPKREAHVGECEPGVLVAGTEHPARERACVARPGACPTAPAEPRRQTVSRERGRRAVGAAVESAKAGAETRIPPRRLGHEGVTRQTAPRFRARRAELGQFSAAMTAAAVVTVAGRAKTFSVSTRWTSGSGSAQQSETTTRR
jgi:hypothetical protein